MMQALFIGQLGLSGTHSTQKTMREQRIEALGRALVAAGYQVSVLTTGTHSNQNLTNYHGITLVRKPSLNPQQPGGWLYLLLSLATVWRRQPSIVHVHTWKAAALVWLAALLAPETTFVWTIEALPKKSWWIARIIIRQASDIFDVITVPTRTLQYLLLHHFGLATQYIPDGYTPPRLKDIPLKVFGLRKEQYCLLLAQSETAIRSAIRAYATTKSRKKLVILAEPTAAWQRLINRKSFVLFVGAKHGRQLSTLVRNAATVVTCEDWPYLETLLIAMDGRRTIVAANTSLYQETLGVTAQYYRTGSQRDLQRALQANVSQKSIPKTWGAKAQKRARNHFTWERIVPEYLAAYRYRTLAYVPVDSAQRLAEEAVSI